MNAATLPLMKRWWPGALLAVVVLLVWGQSVSFQFVWDDKYFIEDLQSIRSLRHVPEMFYSLEAQSSYPEGFVLFRPLRTLHYAVLYAIGGGAAPRPWLFHFANLAWHAAATILLFRILLLIFEARAEEKRVSALWIAWLAAAAFAVHPVVSEVVCWAKSLDDLMATAFVLASCLVLLRDQPQQPSRRSYWAAVALFTLALYSKESAVPFALFCVPLFVWRTRRGLWPAIKLSLPFLAVAFVFIVHRHLVIGRTSQTAPLSGSYVQTLIDTLPAGSIYARLLAGIPPFCIDYSHMNSGNALSTPTVLVGGGAIAAVLLLTAWAFRRRQVLAGAGLLWLLLFMLPFSNLIPMMQFCGERFLYLPIIGWIVALGSLVLLIPRRNMALTISTLVLVGWSAIAWHRSWIWHDAVTLFVQTHLEGPTSARVQDNAVAAAFDLPHMRVAFTRIAKPGQASELVTSPTLASHPPDWLAVESTISQLHNLFPKDTAVTTALAVAKALQGRPEEAIPFFELAAQQQPERISFWNNLARACVAAGRDADAGRACERALALDSAHRSTLEQLADIQWRQKNFSAARETYGKLRAASPENREFAERVAEAERQLASLAAPSR
jgi:protein O-mannosyl-transferase